MRASHNRFLRHAAMPPVTSVEEQAQSVYETFRTGRIDAPGLHHHMPSWEDAPPWARGLTIALTNGGVRA